MERKRKRDCCRLEVELVPMDKNTVEAFLKFLYDGPSGTGKQETTDGKQTIRDRALRKDQQG